MSFKVVSGQIFC